MYVSRPLDKFHLEIHLLYWCSLGIITSILHLECHHGMTNCNPLSIPFPVKADAIISDRSESVPDPDPTFKRQYAELIGELLYCP